MESGRGAAPSRGNAAVTLSGDVVLYSAVFYVAEMSKGRVWGGRYLDAKALCARTLGLGGQPSALGWARPHLVPQAAGRVGRCTRVWRCARPCCYRIRCG